MTSQASSPRWLLSSWWYWVRINRPISLSVSIHGEKKKEKKIISLNVESLSIESRSWKVMSIFVRYSREYIDVSNMLIIRFTRRFQFFDLWCFSFNQWNGHRFSKRCSNGHRRTTKYFENTFCRIRKFRMATIKTTKIKVSMADYWRISWRRGRIRENQWIYWKSNSNNTYSLCQKTNLKTSRFFVYDKFSSNLIYLRSGKNYQVHLDPVGFML